MNPIFLLALGYLLLQKKPSSGSGTTTQIPGGYVPQFLSMDPFVPQEIIDVPFEDVTGQGSGPGPAAALISLAAKPVITAVAKTVATAIAGTAAAPTAASIGSISASVAPVAPLAAPPAAPLIGEAVIGSAPAGGGILSGLSPLAAGATILGVGGALLYGAIKLGDILVPSSERVGLGGTDIAAYNEPLYNAGILKRGGGGGAVLGSDNKPIPQLL